MTGSYDAEGVIWLERPLPADLFTDGPWLAATPAQAGLLAPGYALTREWIDALGADPSTGNGLLLLPGLSPATVAGLAWRVDGKDLSETLLLAGLDRFAQAAAPSRAVLWGVSLSNLDGITVHPAVLDHTGSRFLHRQRPPMPAMDGVWFPSPRRRAALFTPAEPAIGPAHVPGNGDQAVLEPGPAARPVPAPEPAHADGPFGPVALALAAAHPGLSKGALIALHTFAALWDTTQQPVPTAAVARHAHLTERTAARHLGQWTVLHCDGSSWIPVSECRSPRRPTVLPGAQRCDVGDLRTVGSVFQPRDLDALALTAAELYQLARDHGLAADAAERLSEPQLELLTRARKAFAAELA